MNLAFLIVAAVELIAPADRSVVKLLPECQREILADKTLAEREAMFDADKKGDRHLPRMEIDLGFGWRFASGPRKNAMLPSCDDAIDARPAYRQWCDVDLPHDFQFLQPWDPSGGRSRGYKASGCGWYRRRLFADPAWKGKRVALDFGGVMCQSEIYLNGAKIADRVPTAILAIPR